jgi:hypothetical protein
LAAINGGSSSDGGGDDGARGGSVGDGGLGGVEEDVVIWSTDDSTKIGSSSTGVEESSEGVCEWLGEYSTCDICVSEVCLPCKGCTVLVFDELYFGVELEDLSSGLHCGWLGLQQELVYDDRVLN